MTYTLPKLNYGYDALEPWIDAKTMEIHHGKHHQAYIDKLNDALKDNKELQGEKVEELLSDLGKIPEKIRNAVRNHGGGHYNHSLFWELLKKDVTFEGKVANAIVKKYGSYEKFVEEFSNCALSRFGSGWAWLVVNDDKLEIISTANQDCPISDDKIPILALDLWEHAFYLKYQNRKAEYVKSFWNVINWKKVNELYERAIKYSQGHY